MATAGQRSPVLSSVGRLAVKTWVPSGISRFAIVIGVSNTGTKPLRTKSLPSLRLTNSEIGSERRKVSAVFASGVATGSGADGSIAADRNLAGLSTVATR